MTQLIGRITATFLLLVAGIISGAADPTWHPAPSPLMTKWAADVTPEHVHPEYPRPQMVRADWLNLNGLWNFAMSPQEQKAPVSTYTGQILVPFPVQSPLSGVTPPQPDAPGRQVWEHMPEHCFWYQRTFTVPDAWKGRRVLLHFGAVSWEATVFVNGKEIGAHHGDYDGFSFDITDALKPDGPQDLVVSAWDPIQHGTQPIGKQSSGSFSIYYTASSGIWQTVWLEPVAQASIEHLKVTPDVDGGKLKVIVAGQGTASDDTVEAVAAANGAETARISGPIGTELSLAIANGHLWSPEDPFLYDLKVTLHHGGQAVDSVTSYFGMRKIAIQPDDKGVMRVQLNGKRIFLLGVLDQGFWPDGLYAAPTDEALRSDIEMMKKYGFNIDRKHVKVEPERWYYWCDKLGMLVWQDMPNMAGNMASSDVRVTDAAAQEFQTEFQAIVDGRGNHPCIVQWTVFNESWGQFDTWRLTTWLKNYDPTRLIDSASGWTDFQAGDIRDRHDYSPVPRAPDPDPKRALMLGEFGAVSVDLAGHVWTGPGGYDNAGCPTDPNLLATAYPKSMDNIWSLIDSGGLAGALYTQLTDVEKEPSGLLTYDRVSKVDPKIIADANHGGPFASVPTNASTSSPASGK